MSIASYIPRNIIPNLQEVFLVLTQVFLNLQKLMSAVLPPAPQYVYAITKPTIRRAHMEVGGI